MKQRIGAAETAVEVVSERRCTRTRQNAGLACAFASPLLCKNSSCFAKKEKNRSKGGHTHTQVTLTLG